MRLSITTVEAYRLYRDGDWMELEKLEAQIKDILDPMKLTNLDPARYKKK